MRDYSGYSSAFARTSNSYITVSYGIYRIVHGTWPNYYSDLQMVVDINSVVVSPRSS